MDRYLELFLEESREILSGLSAHLRRAIEVEGDEESLQQLFRGAHSIKGMASTVGMTGVADLAHALEEMFSAPARGEWTAASGEWEAAWRGVDALGAALERIERGEEPPALDAEIEAIRRRIERGGATEGAEGGHCGEKRSSPPLELEIRIDPEAPLPSARALVALRRLSGIGRVLWSDPPEEELLRGETPAEKALRLRVRLASDEPAERIRERMERLDQVLEVCCVEEETPLREEKRPPLRVPAERVDALLDGLSGLHVRHAALERMLPPDDPSLALAVQSLGAELRRLTRESLEIRMVPFDSIRPALERAVRHLARQLGKRATLEVRGAGAPLDRAVLEALADPLNHLIRNALDHGIETPEEREGEGKCAEGTVRIRLERSSDTVTILLEDDGRGMDASAIRARAVESGLVPAERASTLEGEELLLLTTHPGFTTRSEATPLSGRGVGLDAVRERIARLGGVLELDSREGRGTRVTMHLPPTQVILPAFLVRAGGELFAVPLRRVERTFEFRGDEVRRGGRVPFLVREGESIELFDLRAALEGRAAIPPGGGVALVHRVGGKARGAVVEAVIERRELVVKPLREPLEGMREYTGASPLGDGQVVLIVDLECVRVPSNRGRCVA